MTSEEIHFDPRSIDVCVDSLLRLKKDGRYNPNGLWDSEILPRLNNLGHWSKDLPLISEAEDALRFLGGAQSILECLLESLQATISAVTTALRPFQCGKGLESLPNDVLSMIFMYTGSRSTLSCVCRRFRQVASAIPQLWSSISNDMKSIHQVNRYLKKSKVVGLHVGLYLKTKDPPRASKLDLLSVLDAALVHVDRWESLHFSVESDFTWSGTEACITKMDERLKNIHFPRLQTLFIDYPDVFDDIEEDYGADPLDDPNSAVHFYRTWSMPNLHELTVESFIPVPFAAPALSSVTITLCKVSDRDDPSALRLIEFLSSIPHLEDLHLTLGNLDAESDLPPLVLSHLKSFRLDVMQWMISCVAPFTEVLITPIIHSMHLHIERYDEGDPELTEWLQTFLCHDDKLDYEIPFRKLTALETLTLDTAQWQADFDWDDMEDNGPIPPLHSLRLLGNIDSRWRYWLECVKKKMQVQGKFVDFERLTICEPDVLDADDVEAMFAGKRVVWEETPDRGSAFL